MLIGILLFRRRSRVVWAGAVLNFAITAFYEVQRRISSKAPEIFRSSESMNAEKRA
jgi:hypothetical protein